MAERAFIHRPFDGHIRMKPTGVLLAKLRSSPAFVNAGDYENVTYSMEVEEEEIFSPQTPERSKIATLPTESSIQLSFELSQLTEMFRSIVYASAPDLVFEQDAVAAQPFEFEDLEVGHIIPTGLRNVTAIAIPDYVEGTHFQFDGPTGHLEILAHPGNVKAATVAGTVTAGAVAGRSVWGFLSNTNIRGSLMFRSTNKYGPKQLVEFWDVKFRVEGDQTLGSNSTDWATVTITGEVFADPTKPVAFAYGQVTDLP